MDAKSLPGSLQQWHSTGFFLAGSNPGCGEAEKKKSHNQQNTSVSFAITDGSKRYASLCDNYLCFRQLENHSLSQTEANQNTIVQC